MCGQWTFMKIIIFIRIKNWHFSLRNFAFYLLYPHAICGSHCPLNNLKFLQRIFKRHRTHDTRYLPDTNSLPGKQIYLFGFALWTFRPTTERLKSVKRLEVTIGSTAVQFISQTASTCRYPTNLKQLPKNAGREFCRLLWLRMCAIVMLRLRGCYFLQQAQWHFYVTYEMESMTSKQPRFVLNLSTYYILNIPVFLSPNFRQK